MGTKTSRHVCMSTEMGLVIAFNATVQLRKREKVQGD